MSEDEKRIDINIPGNWQGNIGVGDDNEVDGVKLPNGISLNGSVTPRTEQPTEAPKTPDQAEDETVERRFNSPFNENLISRAKKVRITSAVGCTFTFTNPESVRMIDCVRCKIIIITDNPANVAVRDTGNVNTTVEFQNPAGETLEPPTGSTPRPESPPTTFFHTDEKQTTAIRVGGKISGQVVTGDNQVRNG